MPRLTTYLRPYWGAAVAAPLLMLLEVVMDLLQPTLMASLVDRGVLAGDTGHILRTGALMLVAALVGLVGGVGCTYYASKASIGFATDLRRDLFAKVQGFSFNNLDRFPPGSLVTRLTNDVTQVQNMVFALLRVLVRTPLLTVGGTVMAVAISPRLALVLLVALPILVVSVVTVMRRGFPLFSTVQRRLDTVNDVLQENLAGVRVIKAFVRGAYESERFARANQALMAAGIQAGRLMGAIPPVMILVMNGSLIAVLWLGGWRVQMGGMEVGQVLAFTQYLTQILFALMMLAFFFVNISRAKASADRIREVLATQVDITDRAGLSPAPIREGRITFENVTFQYQGAAGPPVLKGISFTVEPGQRVAILGATGSGKSTLVHLLARFYDVTSGRITLDGRDIREIPLATLRQSLAMVLQESILFTGTIRENIAWGRPDATDDEIVACARAAQAHDFIAALPEGYQTLVGQRGVNLSGGQKQRIAIARALLRRPKVLILDDSTSALDMATEARLLAALRQRAAETTCLVIAQRISTVLDADQIIVLEDGEIVGIGRHHELLRSCPVYQEIYRSQLGKEVLEHAG